MDIGGIIMNSSSKETPFKKQYKVNQERISNKTEEHVSLKTLFWYAFLLIASAPLPWLGLPFYILYKNEGRKIHPYVLSMIIFGSFLWVLIFVYGAILLYEDVQSLLDFFNR